MLSWIKEKLTGSASGDEAVNRDIREGYRLHLAQDFGRAEAIYRSVLQRRPGSADVLYLLSRLKLQLGDLAPALELGERAAQFAPGTAAMHAHLAELYCATSRLASAEASYRKALELEPGNAEWWNDLGALMADSARNDEALACYERALKIDPGLAQALYNAARIHGQRGLHRKAIEYLERAAGLRPESAEIFHNLGNAMRALGRYEEARSAYQRALELKPDFVEAWNGMGVLLTEMGKAEEGLAHFNKALALKPDHAQACTNRGAALASLYRVKEAIADYRRALEIQPDYPEACNNLAALLGDLAEFGETYVLLKRALELKPGYAEASANYLFTLNYDPERSAEEVFAGYREKAVKPAGGARAARASWDGRRRLRVGYVSPDFRRHSARHFLEPILAHHDRSAVEVHCYAEVRAPDELTATYTRYADHWCSTVGMSDDEVAAQIAQDGIDVLVDLAGHTSGNRLGALARRPAPVQVTNPLGYGYTAGMESIDWFLADRHFVPEHAQRLYSEKIWYLNRIPFSYRADPGMPEVGELPALKSGTVTFGCFSRAIRINYKVVRLWSRILKAVPGSRLLLNTFVFDDPWVREEFRARFAAHGIDGERIELVATRPISATWEAYHRVDITLDPFPHNAGTTLYESLWMGVPCVSLRGVISLGRFGDMILSALDMQDWVADDEEGYLAIAVGKARALQELAKLRRGFRERMRASPICDEKGLARAMEEAYRGMVRAAS